FSPVQGALSDRFGRRPVILVSNFGLGLDYVVMALAPNLAWLFAGRVISGICAASISTSFAYIADVTPPEQRSARFGMIGAAFGVGGGRRDGAGGGRLAGRARSAPAVLGGSGLQPAQRGLWPRRAAGVARARQAHAAGVAARQPDRLADAAAHPSRAVRPRRH